MKCFKSLMLLVLAAVSFSSCTKVLNSDYDPESGDKYAVKVRVVQPSTKAVVQDPKADLTVNSLQVFAFLNGNLDVYGESQADTLTLSCTQGTRRFYALINAPSLSTVTTENELLNAASDLSNSSLSSLEMVGDTLATIGKTNKTVEVNVSRIASRIVVSKITKAFVSTALQRQKFVVKRMYLVNASGKAAYGAQSTPLVWYNQKCLDEQLPVKIGTFMKDSLGIEISSSYTEKHTFYCYPNSTENDTNGGQQFTPRFTRLVIEAELGEELCYYPINLPNLESNKSYNISEIKITKPGSTSPDEPVTVMNCEVILNIEPWTDISVTEGTTV